MTRPTPPDTSTAFWLEAFTNVVAPTAAEGLEILETLFNDWRRRIAPGMSNADRAKVIAAKDARKAQLQPRRVA